MTRLTRLALAAVLLLGARAALAEDDAFLRTVLRSSATQRADHDGIATEVLGALAAEPDTHRSDLAAAVLEGIDELLRDPDAIVEPIERLLESGRPRGYTLRTLSAILRRHRLRRGDVEGARAAEGPIGYLGHFATIGPFDKDGFGDLTLEFPPEAEIDLAARYRDGWQELEWRLASRDPDERTIDPRADVYPRGRGVTYQLFQLRSDEERDAVLCVASRAPLRIRLGGRAVVDDRRPDGRFRPLERHFGVRLRAGWNRLLVRAGAPYWICLTDPAGRPLPAGALSECGELVLQPEGDPPSSEYGGPPPRAATAVWAEAVDARAVEPGDPGALDAALAHLGIASLHGLAGVEDQSVARAERALELAPDDPWVLFRAGNVLESASYLPGGLAKNRSQRAFERSAELDPAFIPARLHLAQRLLREDQLGEAAKAMRDLELAAPESVVVRAEALALWEQLGWSAELSDSIAALRRVAPVHAAGWRADARRWQRLSNPTRADEALAAGYAHDRRQTWTLSTRASWARRRGRPAEAESLLRERVAAAPRSLAVARELVDLLIDVGKAEEGLALLRARVDERPWDPEELRALAAASYAAGREDESASIQRRVQALAPGDLRAARWLAEERADEAPFWAAYDERLEDWIPRVPASGPLVENASSVLVLDLMVVRVFPDGSSSEYVHQAFRLLSEQDKDELAQVRVPGEVITLHTVLEDGTRLEPVAALSGGNYVLPGLVPGAYTEYAFRVDHAGRDGAPFEQGRFSFQDPDFEKSFLLSRIVFILPPGHDPLFVEKALEGRSREVGIVPVHKRETELPDGGRVVVYESRDARRVEQEARMPTADEYLPNVAVERRLTWEEIGAAYRQSLATATRVTPEVEAAAAAVIEGLEGDEAKARALYAWVLENIPQQRQGPTAVQTLLDKTGDRTVLFKALLDAAGVPASWALVRAADDRTTPYDWSRPGFDAFQSQLVRVEPRDGPHAWVTPNLRLAPYGQLADQLGGGRALLISRADERLEHVPEVDPASYRNSVEGTLKALADGSVDVDLRITTRALAGYQIKESFAQANAFQKNLAARQIAARLFAGAKVRQAGFPDLEARGEPFVIALDLNAPRLLQESGEERALRAVLQPFGMLRGFGGPAERKHPYVLRSSQEQADRLVIDLGEAYRVARLPRDVVLASRLGTYALSYRQEAERIVVERQLSLRPGRLEANEYGGFLEFLRQIDSAEAERVLLSPR